MSGKVQQTRKVTHSEAFLKAERLGQIVKNQRNAITKEMAKNVFEYLDFDGKGYITVPTLSAFLEQCGVVADENTVYNEVVRLRVSKLRKDEYFEKPTLQKVQVAFPEFAHFMISNTFTSEELKPVREAFQTLENITPAMQADQKGAIRTNVLFRELLFWGVMTQDQIEQIRPFFGIMPDRKTTEVLNPAKILDRVCLD